MVPWAYNLVEDSGATDLEGNAVDLTLPPVTNETYNIDMTGPVATLTGPHQRRWCHLR